MIESFADKQTRAIFQGLLPKSFSVEVANAARRKLRQLDAAVALDDLRNPPGNRLEALSGDRQGQFSIRINRQWRLCFMWHENAAHEVEIVDYHKG